MSRSASPAAAGGEVRSSVLNGGGSDGDNASATRVTRIRFLPRPDAEAADGELRCDADGDLLPPRRRAGEEVTLHHALSTPLDAVGLQLWRAALLLADFVLSDGGRRFAGATVLELGAGTGLVGLLAARAARRVLLTDVGAAVLANCARNAASAGAAAAAVRVLPLDWTAPPPWAAPAAAAAGGWTAGDLEALRGATAVLCADCVYDDELTDALWATLFALFGHCPRLRAAYVAAERRINFSAEDFTARAHAFDHFRSKFPAVDAAAPEQQPAFRAGAAVRLAGRRIDVADVPRALDYERSAELELWELFRVK